MTDSRKIDVAPKKTEGIALSPDLAAQLIKTVDSIQADVKLIVRDHSDFKLAVKVELESHKWRHGAYALLGGLISGLGGLGAIRWFKL